MQIVVLLPALVSGFVCLVISPSYALAFVYLPVLLLLQDAYLWSFPGMPEVAFHHAALLPILLMAPFGRNARWYLKTTDVLVLALALLFGLAQYRTQGPAAARNLMFDVVCTVLGPYIVGTLLIEQERRRVEFMQLFVRLLAIVTLISVWQFRMGTNLFELACTIFFPDQPPGGSGYRFGFARISGPYGGPILAGMVYGVALFLAAWLFKTRNLGGRVGWLVLAGLLAGFAMTQSRGPWLGCTLAGCLAVVGFVRARGRTLALMLVVFLVVGTLTAAYVQTYATVGRSAAETISQRNAAYRVDLIDAYIPTILQRPLLGWGAGAWPRQENLGSIDNHYMLLALNYGLIAVALMLILFGWSALRLLLAGLRARG